MSLLFRDVQDIGPVTIDSFTNRSGLKLQSFVWSNLNDANGKAIDPKGIVIAIHGLSSHVKFDFLNHSDRSIPSNDSSEETQPENTYPRAYAYKGSWPESFNQRGYIFCAYDQQGHGCSESWMNSRCNVQLFDHLAFDALQFAIRVHRLYNNTKIRSSGSPLPITFIGVSMGGGVVLRALSLYSYVNRYGSLPPCVNETDSFMASRKKNRPDPPSLQASSIDQDTCGNEDEVSVFSVRSLPSMRGISMCPNLSLKSLSSTLVNRILMPFAKPASDYLPYLGVGTLRRPKNYPWIEEDRHADARDELNGLFLHKIPAKMCYQNLLLGPRVFEDVSLLLDDENSVQDGPAMVSSSGDKKKEDEALKDCSGGDNQKKQDKCKDGENCEERSGLNDHPINGSTGTPTSASSTGSLSSRRAPFLSLLLVHSKKDDMTDHTGSIELFEKVRPGMRDVQLILLENMWHILTLEAGNEELRQRILDWMDERHGQQRSTTIPLDN